jgi:septum site-determining protein MinD
MSAKVLTITSGKGGVGKTTATANIGAALAKRGQKVACIDADIGLRNLDVVMGLENRIVYDLVDAKHIPGLYLIPSAQTRDKTAVSPSDMIRLCNELRSDLDWILIDSPAGIERGFKNAIAPADEIIVITNPEVSAVRDADRIIGIVEAEEKGSPRLLLNRLDPEMVKQNNMLSADDIVDLLAIHLLGIIPEDKAVLISTNKGTPIVLDEKSLAGQAYRNIGRRLLGEDVPLLNLDKGSGFFNRISSVFGSGEKQHG